MPANAAAWYMAKRRFYMANVYEYQLLPFLLKHYPRKFSVKGNTVEFLETYTKEVAKRKLHFMVRAGLTAYFSHKVDEYGVYYFDPYYYENTEPFHSSLLQVSHGPDSPLPSGGGRASSSSNNKPPGGVGGGTRLVSSFFKQHPERFVYQQHSPFLVTVSAGPVQVCTNVTGIVVSMIDNSCGLIQFPSGPGTEKAFFSARALFRDGWPYAGDPMKLPPMEFDGFRIPSSSATSNYTWVAVLVWCGRKPSPKFCSTKADLLDSPYFRSSSGGLSVYDAVSSSSNAAKKAAAAGEVNNCMQVGEVLELRKNGAVVSLRKDGTARAFVPGWWHRNIRQRGMTFVTTTQGVELALKDLIAFYIDPDAKAVRNKPPRKDKRLTSTTSDEGVALAVGVAEEAKPEPEVFNVIGCNVMVLKHADSQHSHPGHSVFSVQGDGSFPFQPQFAQGDAGVTTGVAAGAKGKKKEKKGRKKEEKHSEETEDETAPNKLKKLKRKQKVSTSDVNGNRKLRTVSGSGATSDGGQPKEPKPPKVPYGSFLIHSELQAQSSYDSDEDPSFLPRQIPDPDLEEDEYTDGEISAQEQEDLFKEADVVDKGAGKDELEKLRADLEAAEKEERERRAKEKEGEKDAKEPADADEGGKDKAKDSKETADTDKAKETGAGGKAKESAGAGDKAKDSGDAGKAGASKAKETAAGDKTVAKSPKKPSPKKAAKAAIAGPAAEIEKAAEKAVAEITEKVAQVQKSA